MSLVTTPHLTPLLADAINFPIVLVAGVGLLVPLLAFEILIEGLVLKGVWKLPYGRLCRFTFLANILSLLAGIPTEFLNSYIDAKLLPGDIPGYFARYPFVTAVDSTIYFAVTLLVEGAYAFHWIRRQKLKISSGLLWRGVLFANIASYAVVAPLNYLATRPSSHGQQFTNDTRWTAHSTNVVIFVDGEHHYLKSIRVDGSAIATIVAAPMTDYLVSKNLEVCLFRGTNGNLYLYRQQRPNIDLILKTKARFFMNQVAFSPSGDHVAFAIDDQHAVQVLDLSTGQRSTLPLVQQGNFYGASVIWSQEEGCFFVHDAINGASLAITIAPSGDLSAVNVSGTNVVAVYPCYGRLGSAPSSPRWFSGDDWGVIYNEDHCGALKGLAWPGLDSSLAITRDDTKYRDSIAKVSVRPGLLHLAGFYFGDLAFLDGCGECLFESSGYIYLLDIGANRVGTVVRGDRFILLTPRYEKTL